MPELSLPPSTPVHQSAAEWIYSGVWAALTSLFLVPREPPSMPRGSHQVIAAYRPSPSYLRYIKLFFWIRLFSFNGIATIAWLVLLVAVPIAGIFVGLLVLVFWAIHGALGYIAIHLRYDSTWYVLTDRSMRLRNGLLFLSETTITYENIQNVTVEQGPIQRLFGISDLLVHTAGGGGGRHSKHGQAGGGNHLGRLEGVDNAQQIRDLIMTRVRASRAAGLGDEHQDDPAHAPRVNGNVWSSMHLAVLRDIRDSLMPFPRT